MPLNQRLQLVIFVLVLFLWPEVSLAVATKPAAGDSLRYAGEIVRDLSELPHGVATSYMIGLTLMEQGDAAGAVHYLAHAYSLSPDEDEFATAYRDVLSQLGYLRDALDVSKRLAAKHPEQYETWLQHVSLYVAMERYDEAMDAMAAFRQNHPDSLQLGLMQAELLLRSRKLDAALAAYRSLLPDLPEERDHIYMAMAETAVRLERNDEATEIWAEGLAALPESHPLRLGALQHLVVLGHDAQAMAVAMAGDSLSSVGSEVFDTSWVRTATGLIVGEGRDASAVEFLQPLFEAEALDLETSLFLGRLYARLENWSVAIAALESVSRRWPESPLARMFLGEFMAESGDLLGGEQHVRRAIEMDPSAHDFLLSLISILSRRHPDAFAHGDRLPSDDPLRREVIALADKAQDLLVGGGSPSSHMMIGATFQAMGDYESAVSPYLVAAAEPRLRREAFLNLSLAYDKLGRHEDALEVLESLLSEHEGDPVVLNALGYSLADQGLQLDRAEHLIRAALKQDPDNPAYLDSLGWLYYRQGAHADAIDYLINAANALPEDPEILEHLGMVLLELGRHERALEILKRALTLGGDAASLRPVIEELEPVKQ